MFSSFFFGVNNACLTDNYIVVLFIEYFAVFNTLGKKFGKHYSL